MKKIIAALLAALLLGGCALAQDAPIAIYEMPENAHVQMLFEQELEAPEGLEAMYELMQTASWNANVYLLRMENGLALASVSNMMVEREQTAHELLARWPQIASEIGLQVTHVNDDPACASVETLYGREMLHIRTEMTVGGDLALKAEAFAFCRGTEITEIWTVHPDPASWQGDAQKLADDMADIALFTQSLEFPDSLAEAMDGVPYQDGDGRFEMIIPAGSEVITVHSSQEEIASVRQRYIQANPAGAEAMFDEFMKDAIKDRSVLIFTGDMQGVIQVFASHEPDFAGKTPEELCRFAPSIQKSLQQIHDVVKCLVSDDRLWVSTKEHALLGYWLRKDELDLQLDLMAWASEDGWLYEIDVYSSEANQEVRGLMHTFIGQTMLYTPPVNGLE